ncbi:MAG TPA: hypothetical protein VGJ64_05535 [Gemmatimonadaceae bacterium]|jgi:hypothetical protein
MIDSPPARDAGESNAVRYGCVGCLTLVAGAFSGGMIAVLIAKVVGSVRNCAPAPDLPACDWHVYAAVGMLIGAVTLPVLTLMRLRRSERAAGNSR